VETLSSQYVVLEGGLTVDFNDWRIALIFDRRFCWTKDEWAVYIAAASLLISLFTINPSSGLKG
jgi:hypothetical protein